VHIRNLGCLSIPFCKSSVPIMFVLLTVPFTPGTRTVQERTGSSQIASTYAGKTRMMNAVITRRKSTKH
jgi:hypothetical protein